jgi:hypothetical protein
MARAEFSERHYELAINIELVRDSNQYFVPSQVEEATGGYDIALVPALPPLWASLTAGLPGIGPAGDPRLPRATSLFLQYKKPEHISNRRGKQSTKRAAALGSGSDVPYYRFKMPKDQLEVLLDLETTVSGRAAVCYAAGVFHRRADFYHHKETLTVAENSTFLPLEEVRAELLAMGISPTGLTEDHCWTYDESGSDGLLCSESRRIEGRTLEGLRDDLRAPAAEAEALEGHVGDLTRSINEWRDRWEMSKRRRRLPIRRDEELPSFKRAPRQIEEATPAVRAQQFLDSLGIGWFLAIPARRRGGEAKP